MTQVIAGFDYQRLREYLRRVLEVAQDTGTATRKEMPGSIYLQDATKSWAEDMWKDYFIEIVEGAGEGQLRRIVSNTANTITVDSAWTIPPDLTSRYAIRWTLVAKQAIVSPLTAEGYIATGISQDLVNLAKSSDVQSIKGGAGETPRTLSNLFDQLTTTIGRLNDTVNRLDSILSKFNLTMTELRDTIRGEGNKTLTDLNDSILTRLSEDTFTGKIDVPLSTRLSGDTFVGKVDVPLSTRLSEASFLDRVDTKLSTRLSEASFLDRADVKLSTRLSESTFLDRADVKLSTRLSEASFLDRVDTKLSTRLSESTFLDRADVKLSTRASESTLSGIKTQTDRLTFDAANRLAIQDPPNLNTPLSGIKTDTSSIVTNTSRLDVALSSRLSESTFTSRVDTTLSGVKSSVDAVKSSVDARLSEGTFLGRIDIKLSEVRNIALRRLSEGTFASWCGLASSSGYLFTWGSTTPLHIVHASCYNSSDYGGGILVQTYPEGYWHALAQHDAKAYFVATYQGVPPIVLFLNWKVYLSVSGGWERYIIQGFVQS